MFTLANARGAIANSAAFARGSTDAREGRVGSVTIESQEGLLAYRGVVRVGTKDYHPVFEYDEEQDVFVRFRCDCDPSVKGLCGCRHAAALMVAVCGGAGEWISAQEGGDFIDELLGERRSAVPSVWRTALETPVRLYPVLFRASDTEVQLGLKIGRTRPYVVSLGDFAGRVQRQELVVYGRELTTTHRESEIAPEDAALFGQLVMLAGDEKRRRGAGLVLSGAELDQTMRLLVGREIEARREKDDVRSVRVRRGSLHLPLEMERTQGRAQLHVLADEIVLGQSGAYRFKEDEIVCAWGQDFERIAGLLQIAQRYPQGVRFDEAQLDTLLSRVVAPAMADVDVRKGQQILSEHLPMPVTPKLYVDKAGDRRLSCRVRFDYCGTQLAPGEENPHIRRNTALEEDVLYAVRRVFPQEEQPGEYFFEGNDDACFAVLSEQLPGLEAAGEVMITPQLLQSNIKKKKAVTFGLTAEHEKLILKADLDGFEQADLDVALTAYRQKKKYVRLRGGTFLSGEALEQAADAAQVLDSLDVTAEEAQQGTQVPMSRALYLDQALKGRETIRLRAPKAVEDWTQRLKTAQQMQAVQPSSLKATLRGYQLTGLSWLCALENEGFGGVLADDMGLGKTIQVLSMLLCAAERGEAVRAMVVCPASLQLNWAAEAAKFAPSLSCCALTGSAEERRDQILATEAKQLMITSYDQLRRDVQLYKDVAFTHVLLDEAQNIKNAASQAARAVKALRADHRFAMTGTPIENRLSELWSIFDFVMPGYLLTYKKFKDRFEAPIVREKSEKARENLHLMVAPFILRRMKKDVLSDLPEKVETVMTSEMTTEQRRLYAAYASQLSKSARQGVLAGQERMQMLAGLTRLRQLCCDPRLCLEGYAGGSGKLDQLLEIVRDACVADHHILLFSQFTSMLDLIDQALRDEGLTTFMLTGETQKEERMDLVEAFNAGEADVFLISLKAGGTGLNLTGADVVIHYDPWWNVAAQNQATDRAYRIGQTKGVQVIRLIASDSVEERILHLQESKRALSDGVLLGEENLFTMDAEMLREILS